MEKDLKARIERWVSDVGIREAEVYLIRAGLSSSTAQKITRGKYDTQPKQLVMQAIETALKSGI